MTKLNLKSTLCGLALAALLAQSTVADDQTRTEHHPGERIPVQVVVRSAY